MIVDVTDRGYVKPRPPSLSPANESAPSEVCEFIGMQESVFCGLHE